MAIVSLPLTVQLANGTPADATQVMTDLNQISTNVNANAAGLSQPNTFTQINTFQQPISGVMGAAASDVPIISQVMMLSGINQMTGPLNTAQGADIASAGTINLTTATGNWVNVTGTTTITAVTLGQGMLRMVRFTGILTLTNGASLVLPGGANITTAAGDWAMFVGAAAGVVYCSIFQKINGAPVVVSSFSQNYLYNGSAEVSQNTTAVSLTTSAQFSPVDMVSAWASGGAVSAGTIVQDTASSVGRTGFAMKFSAVTLTGSGVLSWRYRMESLDARNLIGSTQTFQIGVIQDTAGSVNYTVIVRKANAVDNFGAVTTIATSSATSVPSSTATVVTFPGVAMGACGNGVEIEVQAACGAITTRNFGFSEWQLEEGSIVNSFKYIGFNSALLSCQRVYCKTFPYATAPAQNAGRSGDFEVTAPGGGANSGGPWYYPVRMRTSPTIVTYNPAVTNANWRDFTAAVDRTVSILDTSDTRVSLQAATTANNAIGIHATADARL